VRSGRVRRIASVRRAISAAGNDKLLTAESPREIFARSGFDGSAGWILGYSLRLWFVTQGCVEGSQLQAIALCQTDQVRVRNILAAGDRG
jgi:hypothetical protein